MRPASFLFYRLHRINAVKLRPSFSLRRSSDKPNESTAPTLPVLESTIKRIQDAGGFSKKFKENVLINIIFQGFGTNLSLLNAMQRLGLPGNLQYVGTKLHTTSPETRKGFNSIGVRYFDFINYAYRFPGFDHYFSPGTYLAGYYYTAVSQYYKAIIDAERHDLLRLKKFRDIQFIFPVDEGGKFEQELKMPECEEAFKNYHLLAIGHSISDLTGQTNEQLIYPKIAMGGAAIKTLIGTEEIAVCNLSRVEEELSAFSDECKKELRFGVLGCGNIGRNTIKELIKKERNVIYYDKNSLQIASIKKIITTNPNQLVQAKNTLDLFNCSDIILSCVGSDVTTDLSYKIIQKRPGSPLKEKLIFNFASGEREFEHWLRQMQKSENPIIVDPTNKIFPDCVLETNNGDKLIIKFAGLPSNMKPGAVHGLAPEHAQLVRAMTLWSLYQLDCLINTLDFTLCDKTHVYKNYIQFNAEAQRFILEEYFNDLNKRYPEKKEKNNKILDEFTVEKIEQRSIGITQAQFVSEFFTSRASRAKAADQANWDNLVSKNQYFQPRQIFMDKLKEMFQEKANRLCALVGPGGNGKTSLALQFAKEQKKKGHFTQVRFMRMDKANVRLSLIAFAKDCGLIEIETDDNTMLWNRILKSIASVPALIIWDNVDFESSVHDLSDNLPLHQALIITSRDIVGFQGLPKIFEVNSFEPRESYDYVEQLLKKQNDHQRLSREKAHIKELTIALSHHPLTLELAMGLTSKMHLDSNRLKSILDRIEKYPLYNFNSEKSGDCTLAFTNPHNLNTLWQFSEAHLPFAARRLLQFISFLHPEGLRNEFITNFLTKFSDDPNTSMDILCRQSLLQQKTTWEIHRVLQRVIRENTLLSNELRTWPYFLKDGLVVYKKTFCQKDKNGDITLCQEAISHAETWLTYTSVFSQYFSTEEILEWQACLQRLIGEKKAILADYSNAEVYLSYAWNYYEKFNSEYFEDKVEILLQQGAIHYRKGNYSLAHECLNRALAFAEYINQITIGQQVIAEIKYRLGHVFLSESNIAAAREHYNFALDIYKTNTSHFHVAATLHRLGRVCRAEGNFNKARDYYLQAHKIYIDLYGEEATHPNIAANLHELGRVYCAQELFVEAHTYYKKSLNMKRIIYASVKNHPNIAATLYELGKMHSTQAEFSKALDYYRQALAMKHVIYGEKKNHPHIASTLHDLGVVYQNINDYETALGYYEQSLTMKHIIYGQDAKHSDIANTLHELGRVYLSKGSHLKALDYYEQGLQMRNKIYWATTTHPSIADSLHSLGVVYQNMRKFDEALRYYNLALAMKYKIFPGKHSSIAGTLHEFGRIYFSMGEYDKALDYFMQSINMNRDLYGIEANHPKIATTLYQLGTLFLEQKNTKNARVYFNHALIMSRALYGGTNAKHTGIALTLYQLGRTAFSDNDLSNAREHYRQALEMYEILYDSNSSHYRIIEVLHALYEVCEKQNDHFSSENYNNKKLILIDKIAKNKDLPSFTLSNQKRHYSCFYKGMSNINEYAKLPRKT